MCTINGTTFCAPLRISTLVIESVRLMAV